MIPFLNQQRLDNNLGRKNEYGDENLRKEISNYDWDYAAQESVWVTFGFLVELSNLFLIT